MRGAGVSGELRLGDGSGEGEGLGRGRTGMTRPSAETAWGGSWVVEPIFVVVGPYERARANDRSLSCPPLDARLAKYGERYADGNQFAWCCRRDASESLESIDCLTE